MSEDIKTFSRLTYPSDLSEEHFFPEAIKFGFYQREGVNFKLAIDRAQKQLSDVETQATQTESIDKGAITEGPGPSQTVGGGAVMGFAGGGYAEVKEKMKTVPEGKKEGIMAKVQNTYLVQSINTVGSVLREVQVQNATKHEIGNVYLHMPNNIALSEEAGWSGEGLGVTGSLTKKAFKKSEGDVGTKLLGAAAGSAGNILAGGAAGIVGSVLSKIKIPGVNAVSAGILGMIGGEVIQKGGEAAFSVAHNPYMEMMFSGIGFRSFKFDFIFRARNKTEIQTVGKIIKMFRQHSRPTWIKKGLGQTFMNYPQSFDIEFLTLVKDVETEQYETNKHLPTLKPCVCSSVETNFTPQGIWSAYNDGAPVAITLGLTFQEMELVMAGDVATEWPDAEEQEGTNPVGKQSDESVPASLNLARRNF